MRSFFRYLLTIIVILFFSLSAVFAATSAWLFNVWSDLTVEEILFHLQVSLEGTNADMVKEYFVDYGLPCLIAIVSLILFFVLIRGTVKAYRIALLGTSLVSFGLLVFALWNLESNLGIFTYIQSQMVDSTFIEDNYVNPDDVKLEFPKKKKNLIYIYLESMEMTFADQASGGAFPRNNIPNLTALSRGNQNFSGDSGTLNGGISLLGSTWTMGALFAQSSGLPLKTSLDGNSLETQKNFFSDVTTLGDILDGQGYKNVFLLGSDVTFGGRKLYFSQHGYHDIEDYYYAEQNGLIPKGYFNFWGFEDEKLYDMAKNRLTQLSKEDQPFNLTMLTVDTHFEDGNMCGLCRNDFGEQYADVFACADRQVCSFVKWIQQQDFYDNTTIIISGDHPTMDKDFCQDVPPNYQRKTFTLIINPSAEPEENYFRTYSTMDMFPTTLAAMGVSIPGNKLGLGVNLFSKERTLIEELGESSVNTMLGRHSAFLDRLANVQFDDEVLTRIRGSSALAWEEWDREKKTARMCLKLGYVLGRDMVDRIDAKIELVSPKEYRAGRAAVLSDGYMINEDGFITDSSGTIINDLAAYMAEKGAKGTGRTETTDAGASGKSGQEMISMGDIHRDEEAALVCSTDVDLSPYMRGRSNSYGEPIIRVTAYLSTRQGGRYEIFTKYQNLALLFEEDMNTYLQKMKAENRSILMAAKYDASSAVTAENIQNLQALGLQSDLSSDYGASFYGIVKHRLITEGFRQESLAARGYVVKYGIPSEVDPLSEMLEPVETLPALTAGEQDAASSAGTGSVPGTNVSDINKNTSSAGEDPQDQEDQLTVVGMPSEELADGSIDLMLSRTPHDPAAYVRYPFYISSLGVNADQHKLGRAAIKIDDVEYSRRLRGLNIVVWDEDLGAVVDSVAFDLSEGTGASRWK